MPHTRLLKFALGLESKRADLAIQEHWKEHFQCDSPSRKKIKEGIESGAITIAKKRFKASQLLAPHQDHCFEISESFFEPSVKESGIPPYSGPELPVLYEDDSLCVLQKLPGFPSVPHSWAQTESCVHAFVSRHPESFGVGRGDLESGILHRLDTGTSGCLVFAKKSAEFERIHALWKKDPQHPEREFVKKTYRALVRSTNESGAGVLRSLESLPLPLTITHSIGHDLKSPKKMRVLLEPERDLKRIRGKPQEALTHLRCARNLRDGKWDLELEIETGVMHQIRVHCAHVLGAPLLGDPIYQGLPSSRLWLHAWKVQIPSRVAGEPPIQIEAPLPSLWPRESG